jgi:hypothetical protein
MLFRPLSRSKVTVSLSMGSPYQSMLRRSGSYINGVCLKPDKNIVVALSNSFSFFAINLWRKFVPLWCLQIYFRDQGVSIKFRTGCLQRNLKDEFQIMPLLMCHTPYLTRNLKAVCPLEVTQPSAWQYVWCVGDPLFKSYRRIWRFVDRVSLCITIT